MVKANSAGQMSVADFARVVGRRYWTLRPLCAMNRTVDLLDAELARGRLWASENGVGDVLEAALVEYGPKPEVRSPKRR
jgi:hypothetical protein